MSVTILEALQCAEINIKNGKRLPPILDMAKDQLHNAIVLLEKGYSLDDEVEPLLEAHGGVDSVPDKAAEVNVEHTMFIKNALIKSAALTSDDHGCLSSWLQLDYGGSQQGFGGYALYLPESWKHHKRGNGFAGHWIWRCLEVAGVTSWDKLAGKTVRVRLDKESFSANIVGIGHIVKDDWFCPSEDFTDDNQPRDRDAKD